MADPRPLLLPSAYLGAFLLVTSLFALWGFANDITNPMVAAFRTILLLSNFESSLVQAAFYGGYCVMAVPAALLIKKLSYKAGILAGLGLYALGCFLFVPAGHLQAFWTFLLAYFVMTCGLSFLETTANPYILAMGAPETATRRLNFAQAFNPLGSLAGMLVARELILSRLNSLSEEERLELLNSNPEALAKVTEADLSVVVGPYLALGVVVCFVLVVFALAHLPKTAGEEKATKTEALATFLRLIQQGRYWGGVVAQTFYVGAQIMVWTFIIHYGVDELGLSKADAQSWNMAAMILFVSSRFLCTYFLKFITPGVLLASLALAAAACTLGTIFLPGYSGLLCLVGISACMSLMFPTIYGIALKGLGEDAKLGSAGLIFAIGGGCLLPPLQGALMDLKTVAGFSATRASFALPLLCFGVVAAYGWCFRKASEGPKTTSS